MKIIEEAKTLQQVTQSFKQQGKTLALVPTMGNLHKGHLQLVKTARQHADVVIVSIFVNPLQFSPDEDFQAYPRTFEADIAQIQALNVDIVFHPHASELLMRFQSQQSAYEPPLATVHCGQWRPGHFKGVTTIIQKLFEISCADIACFGEKDYQQLTIIKQMCQDLSLSVNIIPVATVREKDGLALSSRNQYLSSEQRMIAPKLYQCLQRIKQQIEHGEKHYQRLSQEGKNILQQSGLTPEYLAICRQNDLQLATVDDRQLVVLVAAKLGRTRLIDNIVFCTRHY